MYQTFGEWLQIHLDLDAYLILKYIFYTLSQITQHIQLLHYYAKEDRHNLALALALADLDFQYFPQSLLLVKNHVYVQIVDRQYEVMFALKSSMVMQSLLDVLFFS